MNTIGIVSRASSQDRVPSISCEVCGGRTFEGKSHCPEHIHHRPYVAGLLATLARRDLEDKSCNSVYTISARDLMLVLAQGEKTIARLAFDTRLDEQVVRKYVALFEQHNMVDYGQTKRGQKTVKLRA